MEKKMLTAKQVEFLRPDPEKRVEVPSGPPKGLYLVVQPSGAKSWALRYRLRGKTRKMTLSSPYPALSLQAARAEAEAAMVNLENGSDPAGIQAAEVEAQEMKAESFGNVAEEWLTREVRPEKRGDEERIRQKSFYETERILLKETAAWKHRDISSIGKPDVLRLLDGIVDRGATVMACRTRSVLIRCFKWARQRGYIVTSPMFDVDKPATDHQDRDRVLSDTELLEVWNAAGTLPYPAGPFVKFLILTAQRRGEAATVKWADIDMDAAMWTLPKETTKAGRVHDVPLNDVALAILKDLPTWTEGDHVWTYTAGATPINSFSDVKEAIGDAITAERKKAGIKKAIDAWTIHDLRRTAATGMAKVGVPPHVLSAILNHTPGSTQGVTSIYNRFRYTEERRAALEAWSAHVLSLKAGKPAAAVPIATRRGGTRSVPAR